MQAAIPNLYIRSNEKLQKLIFYIRSILFINFACEIVTVTLKSVEQIDLTWKALCRIISNKENK